MRVQSLVYDNFQHHLVEVEVTLHPGLPGVQILGLPDAVVRDCIWRIKSAFLNSGFQWPTTSQVIINLRPSDLRKKGTGLDLAVAAALLWETGQCQYLGHGSEAPIIYGEIDLLGEVHALPDLIHWEKPAKEFCFITGRIGNGLGFPFLSVSSLRELSSPVAVSPTNQGPRLRRPKYSNFSLTPRLADIVSVVATGEHPALISGRAGTGKSTVAQMIHSLIEEPSADLVQEYSRFHMHQPIEWRPLRIPHSSTPALSIIGGGVRASPGELTRAHGGILVMDEFLEFDQMVKEALRDPMERGVIELIRCTHARSLPAKFLLLATTNLCQCGGYEPGNPKFCECPLPKRRRYLDRLSGPILDRFAVVAFSHQWEGQKSVKVSRISERVSKAIEFRREVRKQLCPNSQVAVETLKQQLGESTKAFFFDETWISERRMQHLMRVARTFADLDQKNEIELDHLEQSRQLTIENSAKLKRTGLDRLMPN